MKPNHTIESLLETVESLKQQLRLRNIAMNLVPPPSPGQNAVLLAMEAFPSEELESLSALGDCQGTCRRLETLAGAELDRRATEGKP